jgi:hypothetical protein
MGLNEYGNESMKDKNKKQPISLYLKKDKINMILQTIS